MAGAKWNRPSLTFWSVFQNPVKYMYVFSVHVIPLFVIFNSKGFKFINGLRGKLLVPDIGLVAT